MDMFLRKVFNSNKLGIIVFCTYKHGHAYSYVFNLRLYMGCEWSDQSRFSSKHIQERKKKVFEINCIHIYFSAFSRETIN